MTDEFFDTIDSHPMSDEEANERFKKIHPQNLPYYKDYYESKNLENSNDLVVEYDAYTKAWSSLTLKLIESGITYSEGSLKWNADKRKSLVELESQFSSIDEYWAAT